MTGFTYPVVLRPDDNDTIVVSFPNFPEAHTFGSTKDEALAHAVDVLATIVDAYIADRKDIPAPSAVKKDGVTLPLLVAVKIALYTAMRNSGVGKAELARRMDVHLPQIDRLLNVRHTSQLGQIEAAFSAIGKKLEVVIQNEPARAGTAHRRFRRRPAKATAARRRRPQASHAR